MYCLEIYVQNNLQEFLVQYVLILHFLEVIREN